MQFVSRKTEQFGLIALACLCIALSSRAATESSDPAGLTVEVEIVPTFSGSPLQFDQLSNRTAANETISITRLDFLVSSFALRQKDGRWCGPTNSQAFLSLGQGRNRFRVSQMPAGDYSEMRFLVGLPAEVNHSDATQYAPDHPLSPELNGLHWGWQGGYVFLALEGLWSKEAAPDSRFASHGYSFHLANDARLMKVELPLEARLRSDSRLSLTFDVAQMFSGRHAIVLEADQSATHSRANDALATELCENARNAFVFRSFSPAPSEKISDRIARPLMAPEATPHSFTMSRFFLRPELPSDNPLTEEGIALGRALFEETKLSSNGRQSCASCHNLNAAGAHPGKPVSRGATGAPGKRNAMPLFNVAWKHSFFWDGRAASLREQVLQPIQNPVEMNESLPNVIEKLRHAGVGLTGSGARNRSGAAEVDYARLFNAAFGSAEINADRIARALEQFLLAQVSHHSRFDRVLEGKAVFTAEEERGFELFHTEYDPRHGFYGADCFHCHGGALFRNVEFANNGLDAIATDLGRFEVTRREGDKGKFAVPSLRNVAVTAPYMHDGRFKTLEEVVKHYSDGVQRNATLDPNLAKHPEKGLDLSPRDQQALIAFLKTLTDENFTADRSRVALSN